MNYTLKELLDIPRLRELLEAFDDISRMPSSIIDLEGAIVLATGWQDICTEFHRLNPETEKICRESSTHLAPLPGEKVPQVIYRCPLGLAHATMPLIVAGKHLGNVLAGQIFLESPDEAKFIEQARRYGFDENEYLAAMRKVPLATEEKLHHNLNFIGKLAQMLAEQGWQALRQHEATVALQKSEDRHRAILRTAISGICLTDLQGRLLEVNQAYCRMSGYSEQELLAMNIVALEVSESADDIFTRMQKLRESGEAYFESRHRRKDGTVIEVEVSSQYLAVDGGQCLAFMRDITARKQAEAELIVSERRTSSLFDISQYPFTTEQDFLDHALREVLTLTNSRIGYIYFYCEQKRQFTLNTWSDEVMQECSVVEPQTGYDLDSTGIWGEAVRQRQPILVNDFQAHDLLKKELPEGHVVLQRFLTVPVFIDGEIVAVVGVANKESDYSNADIMQLNLFMDAVWKIAAHKRAEEEKLGLLTQLHQAQKVESIGRLAGGVAHDFNNMLSVILGHAEMVLMSMTSPGQPIHSSLMEIKKAAERSADLTRQLLAFARKQTVVPRILNLNEAVAGMLNMLQRLIGENIHLVWQPAANLSPVMMDSSQIDQIMANLCVNARDAIVDVGEIIIVTGNCLIDDNYCKAHPYAKPGNYVKIVVSDDGKGMDKETLEHIFEPFFTTKGVGEGTGLGLATIYGIVRQNNGFVNVYSEAATGTTFTIYLPRYEGETELAVDKGVAELLQRGKDTVLLVEDEAAILEMTTMILTGLGYTVLKAGNSGEAIQTAREHAGEINLLITDVIMPEMNGRELAKKLLAISPHLKCLFMSGYMADIITHQGVLDEGVHFIQKPFQINAFAAKLREVLDGKSAMPAVCSPESSH